MNKKYGKWAIVTGASSGIGEQFSHMLAADGVNLIVVARRVDLLNALMQKLEQQHGIDVVVCAADLSELSEINKLLETASKYDVGLLVSNAGFGLKGEFADHSMEELQKMVQLNAINPMLLVRSLLPQLRARGSGGIILTGSIEGESPFPYSSAYAASKAFIHSLGVGLWHECKAYGIDVLVLSPGSTDTDAPIKQGISREQLLGVMSPEVVAKSALSELGKKPLHIPGFYNRFITGFLRWIPRGLSARLAGFGMLQAINKSRN